MDTFYKVKDEHLRQFDVLYNAVKSVSVALPDAMTRKMGVAVIELERLKNMLVKLEISPTLSALEKQIESMRCCGNCAHFDQNAFKEKCDDSDENATPLGNGLCFNWELGKGE